MEQEAELVSFYILSAVSASHRHDRSSETYAVPLYPELAVERHMVVMQINVPQGMMRMVKNRGPPSRVEAMTQ